MVNILDKIINYKKIEVKYLKEKFTLNDFKKLANNIEISRGFRNSLLLNSKQGYGLIAEIKKASPSKGIIRNKFDPKKIAIDYKKAGASCISVLTDEKFFSGNEEYIKIVKNAVDLPVIRKDFIIDPIQVYQSKIIGADCILLIVACLSDSRIKELYDLAKNLVLDVLIEVHSFEELQRAMKLKPEMIGINNRNLKNMETSIKTTLDLSPLIPKDTLIISESGLKTRMDLRLIAKNGVRCFLIGESLMEKEDIFKSTKEILSEPFINE